MRTVLALLTLLAAGCTHRLDTPIVTNVTYDDHGRLMVTKCRVLYVGGFVFSNAVVLDGAPGECTYERHEVSAAPPPSLPSPSPPAASMPPRSAPQSP